ncbi:MAG: hypothetical protein ACYC4Q_11050 [Victivallaceae bacterium]
MTSFRAIVKLTFRNAVRSHIFQLLLFLLLLCVVLIPYTITGDGTARGYIQISLLYSLSAVAFVLSLSSVWLGCFLMTRDVESYQLHMVITKPISRITIWLGKWTGIILIHIILLFIASSMVYGIVLWKYSLQSFSDTERALIENEVMVGRRVFFPESPDIDQIVRDMLKEKMVAAIKSGAKIDTSPLEQEKLFKDIKREVLGRIAEVPVGTDREWIYKSLPGGTERPIYLRYRAYVNKVSSESQRLSRGWWGVRVAEPDVESKNAENVFEKDKQDKQKYKYSFFPITQAPEQIKAGTFLEKKLPPKVIDPNGEVMIGFQNYDPAGSALCFQKSDGPKLLIKYSGFTENYFRAVFVIFMQLVILSGLACAAASILSMPTAVFVVISYLMFGSFAKFLAGASFMGGAADYVGYYVGKAILVAVIPMQDFEVTNLVANGELVEWAFIGKLFLTYFVLRALPMFLLGMWLYWRREMGLVIRK